MGLAGPPLVAFRSLYLPQPLCDSLIEPFEHSSGNSISSQRIAYSSEDDIPRLPPPIVAPARINNEMDSNRDASWMRCLSLEALPEEILYLIMDELDASKRSSSFYPPTDGDFLIDMRLVNKRFALLVARRVFLVVALGKNLHNVKDDVPSTVLGFARFLSIHRFASQIPKRVWRRLARLDIRGIRYADSCSLAIDHGLGKFIWLFDGRLTELSLDMGAWSVVDHGLWQCEEVTDLLSSSLRRISLNFACYDEDSLEGLKIAQRLFWRLESIQLTHMDSVCSNLALQPEWSCTPFLRVLVLHESLVSYKDLSNLVAKLPTLDDLIVDSCFPSDHVNHNSVFQIPKSQKFRQLYVEPLKWEFDGGTHIVTNLEIKRT